MVWKASLGRNGLRLGGDAVRRGWRRCLRRVRAESTCFGWIGVCGRTHSRTLGEICTVRVRSEDALGQGG